MAQKIYWKFVADTSKGVMNLRKFSSSHKQVTKSMKGTGRAAQKLGSTFGNLRRRVTSLKTSVIALGGLYALTRLSKSFLEAADTSEKFRIRLKVLLRSVEEGNALFEDMATFARKVPFEYEKIMQASTRFATVLEGGREEINKWMPVVSDIAAAFAMPVEVAADQMARMFTGFVGSARLFRIRGVTEMLGLRDGVERSTEEIKQQIMDMWTDPMSRFRGAIDEMKKSFMGTTSMLRDKWFFFRKEVMDTGPFIAIKQLLGDINKEAEKLWESGEIEGIAEKFGNSVLSVFEKILVGGAKLLDNFVLPVFSILQSLANSYKMLPTFLQELGIVGFFLFGIKGKAALMASLGLGKMLGEASAFKDLHDEMEAVENVIQRLEDIKSTAGTKERKQEFQDKINELIEERKQIQALINVFLMDAGKLDIDLNEKLKEQQELIKTYTDLQEGTVPGTKKWMDAERGLNEAFKERARIQELIMLSDTGEVTPPDKKGWEDFSILQWMSGSDEGKIQEFVKDLFENIYSRIEEGPEIKTLGKDISGSIIESMKQKVVDYGEIDLGIRTKSVEAKKEVNSEALRLEFEMLEDLAKAYQSKTDLLETQKLKEITLLRLNNQEKIEELRERGYKEIEITEWINSKKKEIEDEYKEKREQAEFETTNRSLSMVQSMVSDYSILFRDLSKSNIEVAEKWFKWYKAMSIAEATIDAAKAFNKVLSSNMPVWAKSAMAAAQLGLGMAKVAMIQSQQPPSFDEGGISTTPGMYYSGVPEAHIPLDSGGRVPVAMDNPKGSAGNTYINVTGNTFMNEEQLRTSMTAIAASVSREVAPGAVLQNYRDDGVMRKLIR